VVVVVDVGSLAQEFRNTAIKIEKNGIRSLFIVSMLVT